MNNKLISLTNITSKIIKKNLIKKEENKQECLSIISGGFDPIHEGHIDYINEASKFGNVIIILNTDEWLIRKKGFSFMPYETRECILKNIKNVFNVIMAEDSDNSVCESLIQIRDLYPNHKLFFCNGGDRKINNTPEIDICKKNNIELKFNIGGEKSNSSRDIIKKYTLDFIRSNTALVKKMLKQNKEIVSENLISSGE